jgi:hypothetical protein
MLLNILVVNSLPYGCLGKSAIELFLETVGSNPYPYTYVTFLEDHFHTPPRLASDSNGLLLCDIATKHIFTTTISFM